MGTTRIPRAGRSRSRWGPNHHPRLAARSAASRAALSIPGVDWGAPHPVDAGLGQDARTCARCRAVRERRNVACATEAPSMRSRPRPSDHNAIKAPQRIVIGMFHLWPERTPRPPSRLERMRAGRRQEVHQTPVGWLPVNSTNSRRGALGPRTQTMRDVGPVLTRRGSTWRRAPLEAHDRHHRFGERPTSRKNFR